MTADEVKCPPVRKTVGDINGLGRELAASQFFYPAATPTPSGRFEIVAGERRWLAMRRQELELRIHRIGSWTDMLAWLIQDVKSAGATVPSLVEAVEMVDRVTSRIPTTRTDAADRTICEYLGVSVERMRETRMMRRWLEPGIPEPIRALAREELRGVHKGTTSPSGAEGRIKRAFDRASAPTVPAATQRRTLDGAVKTALGLGDALGALGDLSEDLTNEERDAWAAQLGKTRLAMERVIRNLKERVK